MGRWVALVAVAVLALAACSQRPNDVTPVVTAHSTPASAPLTEDAFRELLTKEDVSALLASGETLDAEYRDFKEMAGRVDPSQVEHIESWYGLTVIIGDGSRAVSFSVVDFDSVSAAQAHYEQLKAATPGMRDMDPPIGESSVQVLINDRGLGGSLVFIVGDKVIPLHTAQPDGQPPLVPLEGIERLAELIASRL